MILVDTNIPLYAEDDPSEHDGVIRAWWDAQLSGSEPVALCWPVLTPFSASAPIRASSAVR